MTPYSYTIPATQSAYSGRAELPNRNNNKGRHSDAIRMQALAIYAETGNQLEVERQIGIPQQTVSEWVNDASTPQLLDELRSAVRYREGWRLVESVRKQLDLVEEAQERGVPHVTRSGQVVYTPQSPKDAIIGLSILIDKQMLIAGTLTQSSSILQGIDGLGKQLANLGAQLTAGPLSMPGAGETSEECGKSQPPSSIDNNSNGLKLSDIGG